MFAGVRTALLSARAAVVVAPPAGPINYVTNGTFTGNDATGWSLAGAATITGDKLVINNTTGLNKTLTYTFPVVPPAGTVCTVSFVVSGFVANGGGVSETINLCGQPFSGSLITGDGTYSVTITAGSTQSALTIAARNNMNLSIDNVQVIG